MAAASTSVVASGLGCTIRLERLKYSTLIGIRVVKQFARSVFGLAQAALGHGSRSSGLRVIAPEISSAERAEITRRARFFFPSEQAASLTFHAELKPVTYLDASPILTFGVRGDAFKTLARLHQGVFDIDWRSNPTDGWSWIYAASWSAKHVVGIEESKVRFANLRSQLERSGLKRCYIFGTGPSLGKAIDKSWSDGIRIVCNTIVRDVELWRHVSPHLIVAGDGIYHFGFTEFAIAFRRDLRARLEQSPAVFFVYPAQFDQIVRRELAGLESQLIPIQIGEKTDIHTSVSERFELPALGNALNLLLLPLACSLSKRIGLWGFDGRAPADQLFWSNSPQQSYTELLGTLQAAHPAFFDHHVPRDDPEKYLRSVHGDVLEHAMSNAEQAGWKFEMLHPTWTPTLARRAAHGVPAVPMQC